MAELLAAGTAARLAVAAFSRVAAERDVAPEVKALNVRVMAAASSVEAMGAAFERDARAAPLVAALKDATAWVERREGKLGSQSWLHKAAMAEETKAKIRELDERLTKCASRRARACASERARTQRGAQPLASTPAPPHVRSSRLTSPLLVAPRLASRLSLLARPAPLHHRSAPT
jgi:hypothetical protein